MSDLLDSVESLKRVVATPGTFATLFPSTTDLDLVGTMQDGLAQAQLDGLLSTYGDDGDGVVTPDLTNAQTALVVLYSGAILIRAELFNRKTHRRYEASGAVFEEDQATNILRDLLKDISTRITAIIAIAADGGAGAAFYMADAYVMSAIGRYDTGSLRTDYRYDPAGIR